MKFYWIEKAITILTTTAIILVALVCLYRITYDGFIKETNQIISNGCNNGLQNYVIPPKSNNSVTFKL